MSNGTSAKCRGFLRMWYPICQQARLLYACRSGILDQDKTWQFETLCTEVWYRLLLAMAARDGPVYDVERSSCG